MRGLLGPLIKLAIFGIATIVATATLGLTIANTSGFGGTKFHAIFEDATSLNPRDEIRIAGVRVGQVDSVELYEGDKARVTFTLAERDWLPESVVAKLRFRNLIGARYIALEEGDASGGRKLNSGGTIPIEQTRPAVNLTTLFNGLRPIFQTLSAEDVDKLSFEIIQVFQGEGGTVGSLVRNTASLTSTLADRDAVIGSVIDNLDVVLSNFNKNDEQFDSMITNTQQLISGLAAERATVGQAVTAMAGLTDATADLLEPTRPAIQSSVASINTLSATLNARGEDLDAVLQNLPVKLEKLIRVASAGSWFQFYLCGIDVTAGPGYAPQLNLPTGLPTINQPLYTNAAPRCSGVGIS